MRGIRKSCAVRLEQAGGSVAAAQSACKWRVAGTVRKSPQRVCFFSLSAEHATHARRSLRTRYASSARGGTLQLRSQQTGPDGGCEQLVQLQAVDPRARRAAQARDGRWPGVWSSKYRGSASGSRRVPSLGVEGRAVLGAQVTRLGFFLFLLLGGRSRCFGATGTGSVLGREKGEGRSAKETGRKAWPWWVGGSTDEVQVPRLSMLRYLMRAMLCCDAACKSRGVQVPVPRGRGAMKTGAQGGA